jgi:ribonucleoside-diphosphate reductase alpha chain
MSRQAKLPDVSGGAAGGLTESAWAVLRRRYLRRDESGEVIETPEQLFRRVASVVAAADAGYGATPEQVAATEERFMRRLTALEFLPNSPTLMNAGRPRAQLAACFVVPVGDSMPEIFDAIKWAAEIQMTGGGTGFSFSRLRPSGDRVSSTGGAASGPLAFLDVFNAATDAVKQGGARRGANMGVLRIDHPDVLEFATAKLDPARLTNFNISVAVTDAFMDAAARGGEIDLINPRSGQVARRVDARRLLRTIATSAWRSGDPGVLFLDRINAGNPIPDAGPIEATNPCVTGDSRVLVEGAGWVPIAELVGRSPRIATWTGQRVEHRQATAVVCTGMRPVLRLRTVEGPELRLTADHRVTTDRGDVAADELERGDRIRRLTVESQPIGRDSDDAGLGELLGWLAGDGHFTNHGAGKPTVVLSFCGRDKLEAAPRLLRVAQRLVGDPSLTLGTVAARDLAYLRSQRLRRALEERGAGEACKRAVPELVWRGSSELVAGYLRGLFSADGSVQGAIEKGVSVRLASNQLPVLESVQLLLAGLGIQSAIYRNRRTEQTRLMPGPDRELREYACAAQHELIVTRSSLRTFAGAVGFLLPGKQERLESALDGYRRGPYRDREYATVEEVVQEGLEEVFDLVEPDTSHFFANGLLVHNCGEQPLLPFESCVLGSVNLARFAAGGEVAWTDLGLAVRDGVHFLDNVIDVNSYPLPQIEAVTRAHRKIGLGVMGFADLLVALGVPYDSERAVEIGAEVAAFVERESLAASAELASTRGPFVRFATSRWAEAGHPPLRNATTTTVAPTGTISILAGCSSGIEPIYALSLVRRVLDGERLVETHPVFRKVAEQRGFWSDGLAAALAEHGRARGVAPAPPAPPIPDDVQALFATAHDVAPEIHVRMQAAFQRHSHSAVSKTVNLPASATPEDVERIYRLAHELGCKGVTVYRDGSRSAQVLSFGEAARDPAVGGEQCPECASPLRGDGLCSVCPACGWALCAPE